MKLENGYYIWVKGEKEYFNQYFRTNEFECKCKFEDCKEQRIAKELIDRLLWLRHATHGAIGITSAFRCAKKQQAIRDEADAGKKENARRVAAGLPPLPLKVTVVATSKSTHELGNAVDAFSTKLPIPQFLKLCEQKFRSIGLAHSFLHLDLRDDKIRRWQY